MADDKPNDRDAKPANEQASNDEGARAPGGHAAKSHAEPERRTALKTLVAVGSLAYAGALAVPAARFLAAPVAAGGGGARWVRVARLSDLAIGEPHRLEVLGDERDAFTVTKDESLGSVWVIRENEGVRALSATCPHLGCSVDIAADKKTFGCPCHTSKFTLAGDVQSGPSPRAMDPFATRVVDGFLEIDFRRFREGIEQREEVGA